MTQSMPQTLGVDISKESLDVHLYPDESRSLRQRPQRFLGVDQMALRLRHRANRL
jgi:hypothetical protein